MNRRGFIKSALMGLAALVPWGKAPVKAANSWPVTRPTQELLDDNIVGGEVYCRGYARQQIPDKWGVYDNLHIALFTSRPDNWNDDSGEWEPRP